MLEIIFNRAIYAIEDAWRGSKVRWHASKGDLDVVQVFKVWQLPLPEQLAAIESFAAANRAGLAKDLEASRAALRRLEAHIAELERRLALTR